MLPQGVQLMRSAQSLPALQRLLSEFELCPEAEQAWTRTESFSLHSPHLKLILALCVTQSRPLLRGFPQVSRLMKHPSYATSPAEWVGGVNGGSPHLKHSTLSSSELFVVCLGYVTTVDPTFTELVGHLSNVNHLRFRKATTCRAVVVCMFDLST